MSISGLSSNALYAKAKAMFADHLTDEVYTELAGMTELADFTSYLKTKTPYSEAFEAIGQSGRLSRRQLEGIIKRMTLLRLEKLLRYASSVSYTHLLAFFLVAQIRNIHRNTAV